MNAYVLYMNNPNYKTKIMKTSKKERMNRAYEELFVRQEVKSKKDFAKQLGYDYTGLIAAMSGSRPATNGMLSRIGYKWNFFNRDWLVSGRGEITNMPSPRELARDIHEAWAVSSEDYMIVEVKNLHTYGSKLWVDAEVERLPSRKKRFLYKEPEKGNFLIVKVSGDSMDDNSKRSIVEGDEILIKQYIGDVRSMPIRTKLFVLCTREGNVIRQIVNVDVESGCVTCRSFNPLRQDYTIQARDIIQSFTIEKKVYSKIIF